MWKLSEEDKREVLSEFFKVDMNKVYDAFNKLPENFNKILSDSIDMELLKGINVKIDFLPSFLIGLMVSKIIIQNMF